MSVLHSPRRDHEKEIMIFLPNAIRSLRRDSDKKYCFAVATTLTTP